MTSPNLAEKARATSGSNRTCPGAPPTVGTASVQTICASSTRRMSAASTESLGEVTRP
ncbi:MAG: hypothetical protein V7633_5772, partial [Pseudonocardia sp.]|jgi:hypothetical protein